MTINVDFDGTCVTHSFPTLGNDIGAVPVLKRLVAEGHQLILFTMRSDRKETQEVEDKDISNVVGDFLTQAIDWFKDNDIPLYGIQTNPTQYQWTSSPKSYAPVMIDDSAVGCPLTRDKSISDRPFVDWDKVEEWLEINGILTKSVVND